MTDKYAEVDLYVGTIVVHHKGDKVSDEDAKRWGWSDLISDKNPGREREIGTVTGAIDYPANEPKGAAVAPKEDKSKVNGASDAN